MDAAATSVGRTAAGAPANSTELMIALSQIQQLIPLLDHRPSGLAHLLGSLLAPLTAAREGVPGETMVRYRSSVEHALRMAGELVARVEDPSTVAQALALAATLMDQQDERARLLRVRKKRRLFVEQEKVLDVNNWGPPVPARPAPPKSSSESKPTQQDADDKDARAGKLEAFLPSRNKNDTAQTVAQQELAWPTSAPAAKGYLVALESYLEKAVEASLAPTNIALAQIRMRLVSHSSTAMTLEIQVAPLLRALLDITHTQTPSPAIDIAALTVGAISEPVTSTTPSSFPLFRALSGEILTHTKRALPAARHSWAQTSVWCAYTRVTETIARLILAAAQMQT